jgi:multiple sugar transport system permease protein
MNKKRRTALSGFVFFLPFLILYAIFLIYPAIQAFSLSFYDWDLLGEKVYIGLANFEKIFNDQIFISSLWHTVYFVLLTVVPLMVSGLLIALLLNSRIHFKNTHRILFFLPYILSISVVCITWSFLYQPTFGLFNQILGSLGLSPINWLGDARYAMPSIALTTIWWTVGFNTILYLAGLQQIPSYLYDAAMIDGANFWQRFWRLTNPLLKRTHALVAVLQMMASLQIFGQVYIMTNGGPYGSTRVLIQYIYENGFRYFRMGYAQAMALIFFAIMFVIGAVQFRLIVGKGESL